MRISDWSSDVCSSDLLERTVPGSFYVNALAVFEGYRDCGIGTRLLQAAAGRATAVGCTRLSLLVFARNLAAARLFERNGYRAVDRSEEHTSELQSLMRISYAVFCLKNKNTPSTQQIHCTHATIT